MYFKLKVKVHLSFKINLADYEQSLIQENNYWHLYTIRSNLSNIYFCYIAYVYWLQQIVLRIGHNHNHSAEPLPACFDDCMGNSRPIRVSTSF